MYCSMQHRCQNVCYGAYMRQKRCSQPLTSKLPRRSALLRAAGARTCSWSLHPCSSSSMSATAVSCTSGACTAAPSQLQPGGGRCWTAKCSLETVQLGNIKCSREAVYLRQLSAAGRWSGLGRSSALLEYSAFWELLHANSRAWQLLLYGATLTIQPYTIALFGAATGMQCNATMYQGPVPEVQCNYHAWPSVGNISMALDLR